MSICNECWGKGWIKKQGVQFDCRKCKGTGVIENEPQTNEEWFDGLSTEEKADFLAKKSCEISCKFFLGEAEEIFSRYWVEWLKKPYQRGDTK